MDALGHLFRVGNHALLQHFGKSQDGGDRGTHFMGSVGEKVLALLQSGPVGGDVQS